MRTALVAALTLALLGAAASRPGRVEIVDRSIEYHGGDLYRQSDVRLKMCSKSGCSDLRARIDGGLYELEAIGRTSDGERHVRITNGSVEGWRDGAPMAVEPDREQVLRDWVMSRVYFVFLPFRLGDPSVFQHDLGLERWDGRPLHKVKVAFAPGSSTHAADEYLHWFDPRSGRLEQFAYSYTTGGGGLRFRRTLNHRRIGGIGFFDQENWGVDGPGLSVDLVTPDYVAGAMRHVSTVTLSEIRVEAPLP